MRKLIGAILFLATTSFSGTLAEISGFRMLCDEIRTDIPCGILVNVVPKNYSQFNSQINLGNRAYISLSTSSTQSIDAERNLWKNQDGPWGRVILRTFKSSTDTQKVIVWFYPSGISKTTNANLGLQIIISTPFNETVEDSKISVDLLPINYHPPSVEFATYPALLVHGLASSDTTWDPFKKYLEKKGFIFGGRLDFCLNYDGYQALNSLNSFDIADLTTSFALKKGDFYTINFNVDLNGLMPIPYTFQNSTDVKSNQEAIVKQGRAVSMALKKIVQLTQKQNITLVGHSMGGLALRQYIQNQNEWIEPGKSHVAKFVTFDTPHGGSNAGTLTGPLFGDMKNIDVYSNAVRDMRKTFSNGTPGVFLFGGNEADVYAVGTYYSKDVNCNTSSLDNITGLNKIDFPGGFPVIGVVSNYPETPIDPVEFQDANINNLYNPSFAQIYVSPDPHTLIQRNDLDMVFNASEEPNYLANPNILELTQDSTGYSSKISPIFSNLQVSSPLSNDTDVVSIDVPITGKLSLYVLNITSPTFGLRLINSSNSILMNISGSYIQSIIDTSVNVAAGKYKIWIETKPDSTTHRSPILLGASLNQSSPTFTNPKKGTINALQSVPYSVSRKNGQYTISIKRDLPGRFTIQEYDFNGRLLANLFDGKSVNSGRSIIISPITRQRSIIKLSYSNLNNYFISN